MHVLLPNQHGGTVTHKTMGIMVMMHSKFKPCDYVFLKLRSQVYPQKKTPFLCYLMGFGSLAEPSASFEVHLSHWEQYCHQ